MGSSGRTSRRWAGTLVVAPAVLLAAGCATMPDSGGPEPVRPPSGADQGVQVRVIPVPPRDGQSPREVLQDFLDAAISDEHDYQTAREYLTPEAVNTWQPDSGAVILNEIRPIAAPGDGDPDHATVTLHEQETGSLDARHTYRAQDAKNDQYDATFKLINVAKDSGKDGKDTAARAQWRISELPSELILNLTNFRNAYQQADRYFFTLPDPGLPAGNTGSDQSVLVPDPIFVRRRIDPASAAALALAKGPSDWLRPAVRSAFDGADPAATVNTDDPRNPTLKVNGVDFQTSESQCNQMAAQLYFTLLSVSGPGSIEKVTLNAARGGCFFSTAEAKGSSWAPGSLTGGSATDLPYARNADTGQLVRLDSSAAVAGVLGSTGLPAALRPGGGQLGPFAVRRDGKAAAVVSGDGRALYLANLDDSAKQLGSALITSLAPNGQGLGSPSWDGLGGLWVVDRNPAASQVYLMVHGQNRFAPVPVQLPVEDTGDTVDTVKLSSDGTRAALLLLDPVTRTRSLAIGLVVRSGAGPAPATITAVRPIAPQLADVTSVAWADPDQLLALGRESEGVQQLHYVPTDGSAGPDNAATLQAVDGMTAVAASEDRTAQVLADSKDQDHTVYSLSGGAAAQWKADGHGVLPSYPG
ncbi:LpqB family beta-propeller domain-containing protein [Kitasatospora sp. LaBMicrA B282]|uniref:LpqB family beta-propeller domain-containing protein n=1 Tax=Kitasatospora sp. LaBMicrA B282 TaxID=3420949 RepID=UPI003D09B3C8